ncbi:MAG: twin transmembrane helix small protein [Methylomonas sp.]|jgi:O-antigen/teichoic acid export membrane protein
MKIIAILVFLAIVASLGTALYHLVKNPHGDASGKTAKALTVRIGLSLILFILLFIAFAAGLFKPQGIGARIEQIRSEQQAH